MPLIIEKGLVTGAKPLPFGWKICGAVTRRRSLEEPARAFYLTGSM